jgi:MoaA/NifB/PqqE/SkfB family radical SAM enzyme
MVIYRMNFDKRKATTAYIEISDRCQGKCPYCLRYRTRRDNPPSEVMSANLFEQVIDRLFELEILDRTKSYTLPLFNWGEPLLNHEINAILKILKMRRLYANISSNFIAKPEIDMAFIPVISNFTLSLSGFSQTSYGRIHGLSLERVLKNFEEFYAKVRKYSPATKITIAWHRYTFNEHEFWAAYKYFHRTGVAFAPVVAYLNDGAEMMAFIKGVLPEDRRKRAEKDLFLEDISRMLAYHRENSKGYRCPAWNFIVLDATGQLLLCCSYGTHDSDHVFGSIFDLSAEEIWERKFSDQVCRDCISYGLARWGYNQGNGVNRRWPSGGGTSHIKLWSAHNLMTAKIRKFVKKIPYVEKTYRKLKGSESLA